MKWFQSKANLIKILIAALLALFLVLGFIEYFIADKAIDAYSAKGSVETFKFIGKDVVTDKVIGPTKLSTHVITSFGPVIKKGLMKATLAFSCIALITVFIVLGLGTHKKPTVSLVAITFGAIILLVLFILFSLLIANLTQVNNGLVTQTKIAEYTWGKNPKDVTKEMFNFVKFK